VPTDSEALTAVPVERGARFPETDLDQQAVARQLERILASPAFKNSQRNSKLLRYVVHKTLEGHTDLLKERTLGAEVFSRPADYDTSSDHIVRSTAGEIRKRLAQFYLQPGTNAEIRIDLFPGSYVPRFRRPEDKTLSDAVQVERPPEAATAATEYSRPLLLTLSLAAAALGLLAGGWGISHFVSRGDAVGRFWKPLFESPSPIAVCVGDPRKAWSGSEANAFASFPLINSGSRHLVPPAVSPNVWFYRSVPFGDAVTLTRLTAFFSRQDKEFRVVYTPDSTLFDLRQNAAVAVGGIDNFWTMHLTRDLRYRFQLDTQANTIFIEDRQAPSRRNWQVTIDMPRNDVNVDYAIVARVVHPVTGRAVVIAGGIRDCGTLSVGEFLTSSDSVEALERRAPHDWMNVEAVISTKVFKGAPGPPEIVAAYFW
jgi:hypothetical protein